jgi:alpha-beta hydrolase superfamily lysophospholipase
VSSAVSAGPRELSPVPERVAEALGANLYLARLKGHGQDGAALAAASLAEWRADVREALEIGARLGRRVVAVGNSTGATLIALALARGAEMAGAALLAPNFGIGRGWRPRLLEAPFARAWLPWVIGRERGFEAVNGAHAAHWTLS